MNKLEFLTLIIAVILVTIFWCLVNLAPERIGLFQMLSGQVGTALLGMMLDRLYHS